MNHDNHLGQFEDMNGQYPVFNSYCIHCAPYDILAADNSTLSLGTLYRKLEAAWAEHDPKTARTVLDEIDARMEGATV